MSRRSICVPNEDTSKAADTEKEHKVDARDYDFSSDDEAPEEVSAAAAAALAGSRRKAEAEARQHVSKRKRQRSSKGRSEASSGAALGQVANLNAPELPSDLLREVKSEGLKRTEAETLAARELANETALAKTSAAKATPRRAPRVEDLRRSDNFRLVVLNADEDRGGVGSKPHATKSAEHFLRQRRHGQKRVNGALFSARRRLGPSPHF